MQKLANFRLSIGENKDTMSNNNLLLNKPDINVDKSVTYTLSCILYQLIIPFSFVIVFFII